MFDKIILFLLVMALAISPITTAFSAVQICSDMSIMEHNELTDIAELKIVKQLDNSLLQNCCEKDQCAYAQCLSTVLFSTPAIVSSYFHYNVNEFSSIENKIFNNHLSLSIYRPPKS